jgi:hypothetical protein
MKQRFGITLTIFFSLVFVLAASGYAQEFSLDDDPSNPATGPMSAPFMSAEDEFGWGLSILLGPSPTLTASPSGVPYYDSDVFGLPVTVPPPPLAMSFTPPPPSPSVPSYVDAYSSNHFPIIPAPTMVCYPGTLLRFSVDRNTTGVANSAVAFQASLNQQPGDIFSTFFAGINLLTLDDSMLGLVTGNGLIHGITTMCPAIGQGTHDNIDAYDEFTGPMINTGTYFALHPADANTFGVSPADIFYSPPGSLTFAPAPFAAAFMMGLFPGVSVPGAVVDSIDGLVIWDGGTPGVCDPGVDVALFSLAPGSATLQNNPAYDGGTVFRTDFTGIYTLFATSAMLGLQAGPGTNVDAMDYL